MSILFIGEYLYMHTKIEKIQVYGWGQPSKAAQNIDASAGLYGDQKRPESNIISEPKWRRILPRGRAMSDIEVAGQTELGPDQQDQSATNNAETKTEPKIDPKLAAEMVRRATSLSAVMGLMLLSPRHRHMFIADMEWLLLPPLALNQYRLLHNEGKPAAFASWALVTDDVATRLAEGHHRLKPSEWRGDPNAEKLHPWIIDLVCPSGAEAGLLKMLGEKVFAGKEACYLGSDGKGGKTVRRLGDE